MSTGCRGLWSCASEILFQNLVLPAIDSLKSVLRFELHFVGFRAEQFHELSDCVLHFERVPKSKI